MFQILNSCIIEKNKYYVFFNVLKVKRIHCVCHSMNMMKMLNYQFIIQLPKVFNFVNFLKFPQFLNIESLS